MYPFLAAAVLNLLNFAFGFFVLPESLASELRRPIQIKRLNPLSALMHAFSRPGILVLVWAYFFFQVSGQVYPSIWTLFVQHKFAWSVLEVGISLSVVGISSALIQGFLTRILVPRLGEHKAAIWGMLAQTFAMASFAFISVSWLMYPMIVISCLSGITGPSLQSMLTQQVPLNEQGELQGSLMSLTSLAAIISPLLYTQTLELGIQHIDFPGLPFIMATGLSLICLILLLRRKQTI